MYLKILKSSTCAFVLSISLLTATFASDGGGDQHRMSEEKLKILQQQLDEILKDSNNIELMKRKKISEEVIKNSISQNKTERAQAYDVLMVEFAQDNLLLLMAECYPHGKNAYLKSLQNDINKYMKIFWALTKKHIDKDPNFDKCQYSIYGNFVSSYMDPHTNILKQKTLYPLTAEFSWYALRHPRSLGTIPTIKFLLDLLALELPDPNTDECLHLKLTDGAKKRLRSARQFMPLLLGEMHLHLPTGGWSQEKIQVQLMRSVRPPESPDYQNRQLAEVYCLGGFFDSLMIDEQLRPAATDEEKTKFDDHIKQAMKQDNKVERNYAKLRYAQHLLGQDRFRLSQVKDNRLKALEILHDLQDDPLVDYIAYLIEVDHYLGRSWDEQSIDTAIEICNQALEKSKPEEAWRDIFLRRLAEIELGLYSKDSEKIIRVPESKMYLEQSGTDKLDLLYAIYKGRFGLKYKDDAAALDILTNSDLSCNAMLLFEKAIHYANTHKIEDAIKILKGDKTGIRDGTETRSYILGLIYLNPLNQRSFDEGLKYMHEASENEYKDSRARLLKAISDKFKISFTEKNLIEILKDGFTFKKIKRYVTQLKNAAEKNLETEVLEETPGDTPDEEIDTEDLGGGAGAPPAVTEENLATEANELLLEIAAINPEETITKLDNDDIEYLMGFGMRKKWTRDELEPYVKAMGGDLDAKTIKFPGIEEVFNFHEGHKGTKEFHLHDSYWKNLKRLIKQRYQIMLQEKREADKQKREGSKQGAAASGKKPAKGK